MRLALCPTRRWRRYDGGGLVCHRHKLHFVDGPREAGNYSQPNRRQEAETGACPEGIIENSPAFQRRVRVKDIVESRRDDRKNQLGYDNAYYFAAFTAVPMIFAVCSNDFAVNPDFLSVSKTFSVGGVKTFVTELITKSVYLV